jgi:hypothetical protein
MASWQLITATGLTLVDLLQRRVQAITKFAGTVTVHLASAPSLKKLSQSSEPFITLFLYRIIDNAEMRNGPPRRFADGSTSRQPLPLELCYLVTPWASRSDDTFTTDFAATQEEHDLLGLILQALYDHAEVGRSELVDNGSNTVWAPEDSLQVVLESLSIEDQYRIWDAAELGYRTSLAYRVRVIGLDSANIDRPGRVAESNMIGGER